MIAFDHFQNIIDLLLMIRNFIFKCFDTLIVAFRYVCCSGIDPLILGFCTILKMLVDVYLFICVKGAAGYTHVCNLIQESCFATPR